MPLDAGSAVAYLTLDRGPFTAGLKGAGEDFKSFLDKTKTGNERIKALSSSMTSVGQSLTKKFTLPLVGAGTAMATMAMNSETSFAKVNTIIDKTAVNYDSLKKGVIEASNKTGIAVNDFNEALYSSISAGVDSTKAIGFTTDAIKLAKGGFTSAESAVDIVTTALNAYGMSADKATDVSDKLITTQNLGKTTVDELASSMGKVIPSAKAYGVNIDNVCAALATLTKNGIATAEATTYYNAMLNELGKSGTTADKTLRSLSGKGFKELMDSGTGVTEILNMLESSAKKSGKSIGDMFGSSEAAKAALTLMKADGAEYNDILKQMESSAGATQKAYEEMDSTPLEKCKKALNSIKNVGIQLGSQFLPVIANVAEKVALVAQKFGELSPETQETIVKFGLLVAAAGPVLSIGGKLINTTSNLFGVGKKLMGGLKNAPGLLSKLGTGLTGTGVAAKGVLTPVGMATSSVGELGIATKVGTLLFNPWTAGIVAAGAGAVLLAKELKKDAVPSVDLFADSIKRGSNGIVEGTEKISEATKNAVSAYMEMDKKATESLLNLQMSGDKITGEIATSMTTQFKQMSTTIVTELDSDYKKSVESLQSMYDQSSGISAEEQKKSLEQLKKHHDNQVNETKNAQKRIQEIFNKASAENRALTQAENDEITRLKNQMRENAVQCLSDQEYESRIILDRMKAYDNRVTAETAGEHVRLLEEQRIKAIDTANREYQERVRVAEQLKATGTKEARESADKIIAEAERQRKETIAKANEIKEKGINELSKSYTDLRKNVDTETGNILSKWEKLKRSLKVDVSWFTSGFKGVQTTRDESKGIGGYATGTRFATKGYRWVGEEGPEIMEFKGGEKVYNAAESKRIANSMLNNQDTQVLRANSNNDVCNKLLEKMNQMLNEKVNGQFVGKAVLKNGEEIAEFLFPFVSNKLAIQFMEGM